MRDSRACTRSSKGRADDAGILMIEVVDNDRNAFGSLHGFRHKCSAFFSILDDFVCIIMTIPATNMTTRQLFGGAITAILPKEYLDARCVARQPTAWPD
jgi:hypothetical protein